MPIAGNVALRGTQEAARKRASENLSDDQGLAQEADGGCACASRSLVGDDVACRRTEQRAETGTRDDDREQGPGQRREP